MEHQTAGRAAITAPLPRPEVSLSLPAGAVASGGNRTVLFLVAVIMRSRLSRRNDVISVKAFGLRKITDRQEKRDQAHGRLNAQNLFWSWYEPRNFGDWVTPYLFEKLTGKEALHCRAHHLLPGATTVFGCGSILRRLVKPDVGIVWGSGIIHNADRFERPLRTVAVRGPRTGQRMHELGFDCPDVYGDPALMLPRVYRPNRAKPHDLGIIPHFVDLPQFRQQPLPEGCKLIDVTNGLETVIDDIASCQRTLSSSLHGVIVSQAYGVPSAWISSRLPLEGDGVKFADYFESVGIVQPVRPGTWSGLWANDLTAYDFLLPDVTAAQTQIYDSCPFLHEPDKAPGS